MPNKMTDEELNRWNQEAEEQIIKALENEIHLAEYVDSDYCNSTEVSLIKNTINIINRQKAEIESLNARIEALDMDCKQLYSDNISERMNYDHIKELWEDEKEKVEKAKQKVIDIGRALKTAKTESVKEFAERLKSKYAQISWGGMNKREIILYLTETQLMNELKEMIDL